MSEPGYGVAAGDGGRVAPGSRQGRQLGESPGDREAGDPGVSPRVPGHVKSDGLL